jgi:hypothetical protein
MNCRSIRNKIEALNTEIELHNPHIFIGTEFWLTDDYSTNEVFPRNYSIFRLDRMGKRGGGVFIGVHED